MRLGIYAWQSCLSGGSTISVHPLAQDQAVLGRYVQKAVGDRAVVLHAAGRAAPVLSLEMSAARILFRLHLKPSCMGRLHLYADV
jgi:hypothetical protein